MLLSAVVASVVVAVVAEVAVVAVVSGCAVVAAAAAGAGSPLSRPDAHTFAENHQLDLETHPTT